MIHVPKTAGTSFKKVLSFPSGDRANATMHLPACVFRQRCEKTVWDRAFKFSIIRNCWDRLVSLYFFYQTEESLLPEEHRPKCNFDEFARDFCNGGIKYPWTQSFSKLPFRYQKYWITDPETGEIIVNLVIDFDHLKYGFDIICKQVGAQSNLPHERKTKHKHYSQYYTLELIDIVGEFYKKDIDFFNYKIEYK